MVLITTALSNTWIVQAPLYKLLPSWGTDIPAYIGFIQLRYFPFFYFGTLVKKHFDAFCRFADNKVYSSVCILLFFFNVLFRAEIIDSLVSMMGQGMGESIKLALFFINGVLGITIVFTFFRKNESVFTKERAVGRWLQYIGRRTLDVYLLHYIFLPYNLTVVGRFFTENKNPSMEFFVSFVIAVLVVCLSLCMSNILRLSPLLEHYLFGVKRKQNT